MVLGARLLRQERVDGSGGAEDGTASSAAAWPFSSAFNSLPILKYGIFLGGTSTFSPVLGLRPLRGARFRNRKLPNPRISTSWPFWRAFTTLLSAASTMIPDWTWVMSSFFATMLIRSAFVIAFRGVGESVMTSAPDASCVRLPASFHAGWTEGI